jgi:hypothetical protein
MDFAGKHNVGFDRRPNSDPVTAFIRVLAIGMMVLGVAFATLDRYELLPPMPELAAGAAAPAP